MIVEIASRPAIVTVSLCAVLVCAWIVFIGPKNPPGDRRVSNVALSRSGRLLAAGTAQGKVAVWDQAHPGGPEQITFRHGSLNDLHFSPDEHVLAIASEDLGMYAPEASAAPRFLRSDHANYGSARFSLDGQDLLVIETIDAHSGAVRLKMCCSSIIPFTATPFSLLMGKKWLTIDWFHITMKLTVLQQQIKGWQEERPETGADVSKRVESVKHLVWHGNTEEWIELALLPQFLFDSLGGGMQVGPNGLRIHGIGDGHHILQQPHHSRELIKDAHFVSRYSISGLVGPLSHAFIGRNVLGRLVNIFMRRDCSIGVGRQDVLDSGCHVADPAQTEQGRGRAARCSCLDGCVLRDNALGTGGALSLTSVPRTGSDGTGTPL
jgi:hypothetical protein